MHKYEFENRDKSILIAILAFSPYEGSDAKKLMISLLNSPL